MRAASLQAKAAYEVWFKCVGRNKYAMFDEVARERGAWDDLCVEPKRGRLLGGVSVSRVRSSTMTRKVWRPTKKDATRGHQYQAMRKMRTAKGRHYYGRKIFEIDNMCVN